MENISIGYSIYQKKKKTHKNDNYPINLSQ